MKKSFVIGKKAVVLCVLVLALSAAVYLNWQMSAKDKSVDSSKDTGEEYLGSAQFVGANVSSVTAEKDNYFINARKEREEARENEKDSLNEIISDLKSSDESKKAAETSLNQLAKSVEHEANIETLLKAKGFDECLAIVNGSNVSIIVRTEGLLGSETVQIQDIVMSQTGISLENIKILEVN